MTQYYEDLTEGETVECGEVTVTREEIVEFAEQYDPQPFHVDEEAARESTFGELIASGWHTAALCMRKLADGMAEAGWASAGARGVDELRWHRPLRPGDRLAVEVEVLAKEGTRGNPAVGHLTNEVRGYNGDGELVISWKGLAMFRRRDATE